MPMIDMPVTPVSGAEVVIERRVGEAGNRGLSPVFLPVVLVVPQKNSLINWGQTPIDRNAGLTGDAFVRNWF